MKKSKRARKAKAGELKRKLISVLVAIVLICIIVGVAFGGPIYKAVKSGEEVSFYTFLAVLYPEKYAYSTEQADLYEYFGLNNDVDTAIILQNEQIEDIAKYYDGNVYFSIDTIRKLFTKRFYVDEQENVVIYSQAKNLLTIKIGEDSKGYYTSNDIDSLGEFTSTDYAIAKYDEEGTLYLAAEFVKQFSNFDYTYFGNPGRVQVYNQWGTRREAEMLKNTNVRYQGGIKSDILRALTEGEKVTVLEVMENWTKIKTDDSLIGYVENKTMADYVEMTDEPVTGAYHPSKDYDMGTPGQNINMVWHQIYYTDDGSGFNELYASTSGIDVVSPTWFYLDSASGTFTSYASSSYVENAHNKGVKVWALVEDMTNDFDENALFSKASSRRALVNNLVSACTEVGADGINIDFEKIGRETGPHYVQFLRELSIEAHKCGLVVSVDNYVKNEGNLYYNLGEQGYVADYVVVMCYDEHWAGSDAGSVASIGFTEKGIVSAIESGVPADKLICGIPFYTRIWRTEGSQVSSEAVGMDAAADWVNNRGLTLGWDDEACQNYISYQDGTALYQVWMEDMDSITSRLTIVQNNHIAGIGCWKLGLENSGVWATIMRFLPNE